VENNSIQNKSFSTSLLHIS